MSIHFAWTRPRATGRTSCIWRPACWAWRPASCSRGTCPAACCFALTALVLGASSFLIRKYHRHLGKSLENRAGLRRGLCAHAGAGTLRLQAVLNAGQRAFAVPVRDVRAGRLRQGAWPAARTKKSSSARRRPPSGLSTAPVCTRWPTWLPTPSPPLILS